MAVQLSKDIKGLAVTIYILYNTITIHVHNVSLYMSVSIRQPMDADRNRYFCRKFIKILIICLEIMSVCFLQCMQYRSYTTYIHVEGVTQCPLKALAEFR